MNAAVIICAYTEQRWDDLLDAVASVQRQSTPADQIIVVIDHNPALLARARAHLTAATVIENTQAGGLCGARNSGVALAKTDVVAFMDEDAIADAHWLAMLMRAYQDPQVVGCGGSVLPLWERGRPAWFPEEYDWVVGCTYRGSRREAGRVRNFIGCNMSFRRTAFAVAGSFTASLGRTATFPITCDETEFCIRLSQRWPGSKLLYEPAARVLHRVPAQRTTWPYFRLRCFAEGLCKAQVTQLVGQNDGLANERTYVLRTLPQGVGQGLKALLLDQDRAAGTRAGAMAAGLAITAAGYALGRWQQSPLTRKFGRKAQPWQAEEAAR